MNAIKIVLFAAILFNQAAAQDTPVTLARQQALEDIHWLKFALEYCHPRLYKYDTKQTVDARFDSVTNLIKSTITGADFLNHVAGLNAAVRCGHLYTIPQQDLEKEILAKRIMPFYIKIINRNLHLFNNCSKDNNISNGSQILSINGRLAADIINNILPIVPADGYIESRKYKLIERYFYPSFQGFDLFYYLRIDKEETFRVEYLDQKTKKRSTALLQGITRDQRRTVLKTKYHIDERQWFHTPSPAVFLDAKNNYAVLTISRSFYDKAVDPDYDATLKTFFSELKARSIKNLIIDLRNNEGGSEHQQSLLMSYLFSQPFRLYEHIYVSRLDYRPLKPIIHAAEKDTSRLLDNNEDQWMRKLSDNLWINNYEYYEGLQLQPPQDNVFTGKLFVMMNGNSFSSTSALIANIKNTTNAIFIGEESGGTYEGPTGGATIPIILPNSKIMVRISPNINISSLYRMHPLGRGVVPDYPVCQSISDLLTGTDPEMDKARSLINGR